MKRTSKRSIAGRVLCGSVCLAILSTDAALGGKKDSILEAVPPSLPRSSRAVPTVDVGTRTIRQTSAFHAADVLPPGGALAPAAATCVPPIGSPDIISRESVAGDRHVDACGAVTGGGGLAAPKSALASAVTIDRMTTSIGYSQSHSNGEPLRLFGSADTYYLSNTTSWQSGAGSYAMKSSYLDHVEVDGSTIRYVLRAPADGLLYQQTDFDSGEHSAQGSLGTSTSLVLEATIGAATAKITGSVSIVSNDPTYYDSFNFYSAIPGSTVPFTLTYTLFDATWQPETFDTTFSYGCTGSVDFAHPTSVPALAALVVRGSAQVPANASVAYAAIAQYVNNVERDVSGTATWVAEPSSVVHISGGVLTTGTFTQDRQELTIRATYGAGGAIVTGEKRVLGRLSSTVGDADSWPNFQADERHTGYIQRRYEPATFALRWSKAPVPGYAINPVASADGRVFVSLVWYFGGGPSLFALDARDGETLWTQEFGNVFSVNPPSWGYGNVYIQTCNHSTDTWLHAFDAETGERIFRAPLEAQWERYYAPTVYDGSVYVDGGYYGGMYALDAYSGTRRWFSFLPQYDQWTPGVKGDYVYAYVGEYSPGLYVFDRNTGEQRIVIADPDFDWGGWSMNLAPLVLENGDAIAIHDDRLIRFDLQGRRIAWQRASTFSGQPSYANGVLYAVDANHVVALSPETGAELWSWAPPFATVKSPLIVTDSHLFVSTDSAVYAIDLHSHEASWSYPAGGALALGDENLYVAQQNGTLVAIAATPYSPSPPVSAEIRGPDEATEFTSVQYRLLVTYADGRVRDRTHDASWSVNPSTIASVDDGGVLTVPELLVIAQDVTVAASYTESGGTVGATKPVHLEVSVTLAQFVERNRARANEIQLDVITMLAEAVAREQAILRALNTPDVTLHPEPPNPFVAAIVKAILAGDVASAATGFAVHQLDVAAGTPPPLP